MRPAEEYQAGHLPQAMSFPDALKAHDPDALVALDLPTDRLVVTVSAAGKTSQLAASRLAAKQEAGSTRTKSDASS